MTVSDFAQVSPRKRPWHHPVTLAKWLLSLGFIGYAAICAYVYFNQTELLYEGSAVPLTRDAATKEAASAGLVPWGNTTPGAAAPQGFVPPNFKSPAPRGTIVFFHGNGESAWLWVESVAPLTQRGFRVFLYEYPGYGSRPGIPSERTIVPDARAVIRSLAQSGYGPIYVWGESLGSGVAAAVCADDNLPISGLTLVCAWDNLANVAQAHYPFLFIRPFMIDHYDSIANLCRFRHPVCVIHGDQDTTVPPECSETLFANLPEPKKRLVMTGYGHGDWPRPPEWWDEVLDFMAPRAGK